MIRELIILEFVFGKDKIAIRNLTTSKIGDLYSSTNER